MQDWPLFVVLALVLVMLAGHVLRRLPWTRVRVVRIENRWIGTATAEFDPATSEPERDEHAALPPPRAAPTLPAAPPSRGAAPPRPRRRTTGTASERDEAPPPRRPVR